MKKIIFVILLFIAFLGVRAQSYEILHVEEIAAEMPFGIIITHCASDNECLGYIIYGTGCPDQVWELINIDDGSTFVHEENIDSLVIYNTHEAQWYYLNYSGCNNSVEIIGVIIEFGAPTNPFSEPIIWKRRNESVTLNSDFDEVVWSTGETTASIEVFESGIYSVTKLHPCGSATYSVEVRDNVELYRATCDLLTNRNKVTWHTTPEQAEYISAVKVYRNNVLVATVPYTDGSFTDDIGSDATQWQYHLVAVSVEGDDCPIPSYWKRTIHLDRIQDSQGNLILQWTPYEEEEPDKETVSAYSIYDIVGGEAHHVVDVGYFTNVYTYNPADFSGYGAVAAVFNNSKGLEDLAFSNRTIEMLLVDENLTGPMVVYPNPTNGEFTVEGVKDLTVFNTLGQTIATSHSENGTHQITVSSGIYFIKGDERVKKVVVE